MIYMLHAMIRLPDHKSCQTLAPALDKYTLEARELSVFSSIEYYDIQVLQSITSCEYLSCFGAT